MRAKERWGKGEGERQRARVSEREEISWTSLKTINLFVFDEAILSWIPVACN